MWNTLTLPTLLYGYKTWAIREQDKSRLTSAEMAFMRRTAKYTWQDYNTNEDILLGFKINTYGKKIQTYGKKCVQYVRRMDRDRQTATLKYEISTVWETKPRTTPQKNSRLLMGPEQVTRPKTLQAYNDGDDDYNNNNNVYFVLGCIQK